MNRSKTAGNTDTILETKLQEVVLTVLDNHMLCDALMSNNKTLHDFLLFLWSTVESTIITLDRIKLQRLISISMAINISLPLLPSTRYSRLYFFLLW